MDQLILQTLREQGTIPLDELVARLKTSGWAAVFLAVDRLSRSGKVLLELCGRGEYRVIPIDHLDHQ